MGDEDTGREVVVDVTLKAVTTTEKGAAVGFEAKLEDLGDDPTEGLVVAHEALCESRLHVTLDVIGEAKAAAELAAVQAPMFPGAEKAATVPQVKSVADCGRISAGATTITGRLSFDRKTVDMDALLALAGKKARMTARRVGTRAAADEEENVDPDTGEPNPAPLREGAAVVHSAGAA